MTLVKNPRSAFDPFAPPMIEAPEPVAVTVEHDDEPEPKAAPRPRARKTTKKESADAVSA